MRRLLLLFVVVVGAGGGACPVGPIDFCEQSQRSRCEFEFRCCKDKERIQTFGGDYVTSEGECADRAKGVCKTFLSGFEDSISLGRMKFNGDKASECLNAQNAARDSCVASDAFSPACAEIFSGLVDDGDDCALDEECGDGGGVCDIDFADPDLDEDNGAQVGACKLPGEKGDDCNPGCARGLVCDIGAGGDGTCVEAPGKGDDCVSAQCGAGLFCNGDVECEELRDDGDDCDQPFECKTNVCVDGACGTGTCDGR